MIECKRLTKIYNKGTPKEVVALRDVECRVGDGEFVLLMGPSGSGKSTLLALMAALTRPTSGKVVVDGEVVSKLPEDFSALFRHQKIAFIFQKFHLLDDLSVLENVALPLIPYVRSQKEIEARARRVMERFLIDHKAHQKVGKLSGGEQQRVAIARSMINDPPIILADEPTANLDARLSEQFMQILRELKRDGRTIVVATHDPRFLRVDGVDRVLNVREGHVFDA
ncbi:MAG: ABC transporter ATP-binding protein [Epsilonproteobacteria bacterium]|nr:ABC transporter ATP-binding protein [Campylobacterota bacterium]NPA65174.1 ABC transporter ATP-binding protein [Campylobacterota bacterium]